MLKKIVNGAFNVALYIFATILIEYTGDDWLLDVAGNTIGAVTLIAMGTFWSVAAMEKD